MIFIVTLTPFISLAGEGGRIKKRGISPSSTPLRMRKVVTTLERKVVLAEDSGGILQIVVAINLTATVADDNT